MEHRRGRNFGDIADEFLKDPEIQESRRLAAIGQEVAEKLGPEVADAWVDYVSKFPPSAESRSRYLAIMESVRGSGIVSQIMKAEELKLRATEELIGRAVRDLAQRLRITTE